MQPASQEEIKCTKSKEQLGSYCDFPPLGHLRFRHGCFITGTFRQRHCSVLRTFWQMDVSTQERFKMGTFWHGGFLAWGIFSTMDILARYIWAPENFICPCAKTNSYQNVPVPKIPCAEKFLCQNSPVLKRPSARMSAAPISMCVEMLPWWNICAKIPLAKISGIKMVGSLNVLKYTVIERKKRL